MFGFKKFYNIHVLSLQFKKTLQEVYRSDEVWRYCTEKLPMIIKFLSLMGVNINTWYMYICTYKVSSPVYRITLFLRTISRNMYRGALQAMWSVWFNVNYKEWLSFPQLWWQTRIRQSTLDKYMINFAIRITKAAMRRGHYIFRVPVLLTELSATLSFAQFA